MNQLSPLGPTVGTGWKWNIVPEWGWCGLSRKCEITQAIYLQCDGSWILHLTGNPSCWCCSGLDEFKRLDALFACDLLRSCSFDPPDSPEARVVKAIRLIPNTTLDFLDGNVSASDEQELASHGVSLSDVAKARKSISYGLDKMERWRKETSKLLREQSIKQLSDLGWRNGCLSPPQKKSLLEMYERSCRDRKRSLNRYKIYLNRCRFALGIYESKTDAIADSNGRDSASRGILRCPVELRRDGNGMVALVGSVEKRVTDLQAIALQKLREVFPGGLKGRQLDENADGSDVRRALADLLKDPDWKQVLCCPSDPRNAIYWRKERKWRFISPV